MQEQRKELTDLIRAALPGAQLVWVIFEKSLWQCVKNAYARAKGDEARFIGDLEKIAMVAPNYSKPLDAIVLPVWKSLAE